MVKHFDSAPKDEADDGQKQLTPLDFTLPDATLKEGQEQFVYTAVKPKDALWARAAAASSKRTPQHLRIAAVLDFFDGALTPECRQTFRDRFEDPDDKLDLADVVPVVAWLAEEWKEQLQLANGTPRAERRAAARAR